MEDKTKSTGEIYEILKNRIIHLEYAPGQVLNEKDVASEFNLSRTPVRRVFEQLKNNNLLEIIPRFGAQVALIDFLYMKSVFEVTRELEGYAARLAADRITDENIKELENIVESIKAYDIVEDYQKIIMEDEKFHEIIFESCGNPCLVKLLYDLHMHTQRLWYYVQRDVSEMNLFLGTMPKIVSAIKARDSLAADKCAKVHIDVFVERIRQELL